MPGLLFRSIANKLQVTLSASGDSLNVINWSTPDGNIVSGINSYYPVIDAPGTYFIDVINSLTNCVNQDFVTIVDESVPPTSVFQYVTSSLTMAGMDISTGDSLTGWNWTFGDGQSS
jgi:PKD repeat protein